MNRRFAVARRFTGAGMLLAQVAAYSGTTQPAAPNNVSELIATQRVKR